MATIVKSKAATYAETWKAEKAAAAATKVEHVTAEPVATKVKRKFKPTIVVEDVTPTVKPTLSESIHADIGVLYAKYKIAVPSTTRFIISCIASIAIGFGIGYVGAILVETLVVASLMLTGSLFLGVAMYILGVVATLFASYKIGIYVNNAIMTGGVDRCYQKCSNAVLGFFSFGNKEVMS